MALGRDELELICRDILDDAWQDEDVSLHLRLDLTHHLRQSDNGELYGYFFASPHVANCGDDLLPVVVIVTNSKGRIPEDQRKIIMKTIPQRYQILKGAEKDMYDARESFAHPLPPKPKMKVQNKFLAFLAGMFIGDRLFHD